jgi:inner membrane transporter RhtA
MTRLQATVTQTSGHSPPGPDGKSWRETLAGAASRTLNAVPPPGLMLLAIVSIQIGAAVATSLFAALGPSGTVFLRVAFSAVLLMLASRPRIDRTARRHLGVLLLFGLVIGTMNLCFYQSIARIPLGVAVTIEFIGPLAVAAATTRRLPDFLWIALAALGVVLLAPDLGQQLDTLGVVFAGLAGVCWGAFVLLSIRVGKALPKGDGLALAMVVAALFLLPFGHAGAVVALADPLLLLAAFGVALLSTTLPLSLEFKALKRMPPRVYGILVTAEPAVAVAVGALLLGDSLNLRSLAAMVCVTAAAIGITLFDRRRPKD